MSSGYMTLAGDDRNKIIGVDQGLEGYLFPESSMLGFQGEIHTFKFVSSHRPQEQLDWGDFTLLFFC